MKKTTLILAGAFIAALTFSSCKKCVTCTYGAGTASETSSEYCSKRKVDRDAYETTCVVLGGTVN